MRVDAIGAGAHIWIPSRPRVTRNLEHIKNITICRVSTGWMSYNYLKSQYLLEGCKSEILEFLQPD